MANKDLKNETQSTDVQEVAADNMDRFRSLSSRLVKALSGRPESNQKIEAPGFDIYMKAMGAWFADNAENPQKSYERQAKFWGETMQNLANAQQHAMASMMSAWDGNDEAKAAAKPVDRRFSNPLWNENPWLQFVRDQYLTTSAAVESMVNSLEHIDDSDRSRVEFFSRQIIDMFSPTNFFATNPDALQKAYETGGTSLVDGFENFVKDLESHGGRHAVTLSDPEAFSVGENIATAAGKVVYRNRLFELIQYEPETEQVYATPLVIIPPWINKFYILDLKPKNSFIRYAVSQGFTVFVVSWVNPDGSYAETGFDDYVKEGAAEAIDKVCAITGEEEVNAIGYCIGGTLLATTLAWMAKGNRRPVANATFFTTLLDFESAGEITAFLGESMLEGLEEELDTNGYLDAFFMARAFSYLRANDLVYGPGVKSYLLGEAPPAFDLLYWNGDSTNLPAAMAREYLQRLYRNNELMQDHFSVDGTRLKLSDIDIPVMAIATRTDHIAPWKASFSGISRMSGERNLVLADSGHIAGIINPPVAKKYGYWLNPSSFDPSNADEWFKRSEHHDGSWWPVWLEWMSERSGEKVKARIPGNKSFPAIAPAPGEYVKKRA